MGSQEVGRLLEGCFTAAAEAAAAPESTQPSEAHRMNYRQCRDSLCEELASLLQEAIEMKWPFVPEKWQYKQSVSANDKTNLSDLISKNLPQLLAVLKASIMAQEARSALSVAFLVDRFLYWTDQSSQLLRITRLLHKRHPDAPIAPQLVIRQARVYVNSGKLQKAEYILSKLINDKGTTGCWMYQSDSEMVLVQAVSVQVRGMILQMLGLWLQAAELIWASLVGFYSLPQPDKKGIGTSLGLLANILVSMNDEDFNAFRTNPDIDFSLLGDRSHRLLSAAQAAKMAVVYSQYASLYVLTNVTAQGTCLLSYSFSLECPAPQRQTFLQEAREAFAIGLLTKEEGDLVTSKQELHTFLKAAYSLTVAHKWLGTPPEVVTKAQQVCQKALANFYDYCDENTPHKDSLCTEIMHLIAQVKHLLQVEPFPNSDKGSFIPDSYRNMKDTSVNFTQAGFSKIIERFQQHHASLSETVHTNCRGTKDESNKARLCITALGTTIDTLNTACSTETSKVLKDTPKESPQPSSSDHAGSNAVGQRAIVSNQSSQTAEKESKKNVQGLNSSPSSHMIPISAVPATSSSSGDSVSEKFEMVQADIDTLGSKDDWMTDVGMGQKLDVGAVESLSQLNLKASSSSLSDSFSSQSSWGNLSADLSSSTNGKPLLSSVSKAGTGLRSTSPDSVGSFFFVENHDSETTDSALERMYRDHASGSKVKARLELQPLENTNVHHNIKNEVDPELVKPTAPLNLSLVEQGADTEPSSESSFEMLEENQSGHNNVTNTENESVPQRKNPLCHSCLNHSTLSEVDPKRQFLLSQQDYQALLAGVCHECLLKRLHSDTANFNLKKLRTSHSALHLRFSKATGLWTARETCVYIGEPLGKQGTRKRTIWVQFLHQEERLSSYVGKDYLGPRGIQFHLKDVERQMTAQYYAIEFNKILFDKEVMAQIFFIPSEALLILEGDKIVGCVTVEPFMLGKFVRLTNNVVAKNMSLQATEYGLAFGHFTYLLSNGQEVVVNLQGWVTPNGKGLTYLTAPQIHSTRIPRGDSNFGDRGLRYFVKDQHGPECNEICELLKLPPLTTLPHVVPQNSS